MKKTTIWTIAIVMGASFLALMYLQIRYINEMVGMKKEQLDEGTRRALYQAARNLEFNETVHILEESVNQSAMQHGRPLVSFGSKVRRGGFGTSPRGVVLQKDSTSTAESNRLMQEMVKDRYLYGKSLVEEVVYSVVNSAGDKSIADRVDFKLLDRDLRDELRNNGITLPFHFCVLDARGREVYRCDDYQQPGWREYTYEQELFRNTSNGNAGMVRVHFSDAGRYIFSSVRFIIPSVVFTIVLLVTFVFTVVTIFRQKRLTEIKNDFINNMTHELKTPISSISLAAQMLSDEAVPKTEGMLRHLGGIVNDESKRLRFLVEKVLQMSMFDRGSAALKKKEFNLNDMVSGIANTFTLRVEHTGGGIVTDLKATQPTIYVDEMHFQNVIFNLMDNAVKYRKPDQPLDLRIRTWNDDEHLYLSVRDNGMGIKKENLRKIFEKFYRVHTGNVHNVKGFGLGLAYVKKMVELHGGEIHAESEKGKGTNFIIALPIIRENVG